MQHSLKKLGAFVAINADETDPVPVSLPVREAPRSGRFGHQIYRDPIIGVFHAEVLRNVSETFPLLRNQLCSDPYRRLLDGSFVLRPDFLAKRFFNTHQSFGKLDRFLASLNWLNLPVSDQPGGLRDSGESRQDIRSTLKLADIYIQTGQGLRPEQPPSGIDSFRESFNVRNFPRVRGQFEDKEIEINKSIDSHI